MDELIQLIRTDIPEGRQNLRDSFTNLERVAEYCEDTYYRSEDKKLSLEETKNYTTQSLASVAYQINTLAYNFLQLLDLQASQMEEMESQMNHISQTVQIHKEKVARREIGVLTANKVSTRQYKIVAPSNPEKPIKYVRKPIDYGILDEIGHGIMVGNRKSARSSVQGSVQSLANNVGPPPTTKPPTPPQLGRASMTGTLKAGSTGTIKRSEYRTPPVVVPPQVPSHYAPNYPGQQQQQQQQQQRRSQQPPAQPGVVQQERGPGYSALPLVANNPMPPSQVVMQHQLQQQQQQQQQHHQQQQMQMQQIQQQPQIGMVHPTIQNPPPTSTYGVHLTDERSSMPPPPSPLTVTHEMPDHGHIGLHTLSRHSGVHIQRPGSQSPPLPPPPPPEEHADFGRPRTAQQQAAAQIAAIVPDDQNLPGWVPKNYMEKVVAIYDYYADKDDELSFQESSVIYVLKKNDDGWWEGVMDGVTGLFPGNYVEPCV